MISFLRGWANQIIVAIIIATIFEMILPNGNNKKYIKMIIGLYLLFTIIQPIIKKVTGNNFEISDFNYIKYFDNSIIETSSQDFENNNSKLIEQAYIDNIKSDIKLKLKQKEYDVVNCNINVTDSKKKYGDIEKMNLDINKIEESNEEDNNEIKVDKVQINNNNNNTKKKDKKKLTDKEKKELIEYLSNEYSIAKAKITIN